jgi:translation initiation factor 1
MSRLFAGTRWDRPPTCDRCNLPESACAWRPPAPPPKSWREPSAQTAQLRVEKRAKGKVVTVVRGLDPIAGTDLPALAARLKETCGTGGTARDDHIEIQGDHLDRASAALAKLGYRVKKA